MSDYDYNGLYQFLSQTPEQGLRKMLVDQKPFTDVHFALMQKLVRAGGEAAFVDCAKNASFPKIKFGPAETKLKEAFWKDLITTCTARGILSAVSKAA